MGRGRRGRIIEGEGRIQPATCRSTSFGMGWFLTLVGVYRILPGFTNEFFPTRVSLLHDVSPHGVTPGEGSQWALLSCGMQAMGLRSGMTHEQRAG